MFDQCCICHSGVVLVTVGVTVNILFNDKQCIFIIRICVCPLLLKIKLCTCRGEAPCFKKCLPGFKVQCNLMHISNTRPAVCLISGFWSWWWLFICQHSGVLLSSHLLIIKLMNLRWCDNVCSRAENWF